MSDLVEFLRARLDEDEGWARAAQDGDGYAEWDTPTTGVVQVAGGDLDGLVHAPRNAAVHIARHDPARVLREVEAKRRIIDEHQIEIDGVDDGEVWASPATEPSHTPRFGCQICHVDDRQIYDGGYCFTLRALALPYADHPSYRAEWKA